MALASSRTLPGQSWAIRTSTASAEIERRHRPAATAGVAREHVAGQLGDVLPALAERRQDDLERVEPEEQVLAELVVGDHLAEVAVGGAEDPDVDPERLVLADPADLARFEEPEQLDLHALVQLADLVEEQRAAVGDLEEPLAVGLGAGEGPLAVAEQLALDQVLGQGAAVDRDERRCRRGGSCRGGSGRSVPCRCRSRPGSSRWRRSGRWSRSGGGPAASPGVSPTSSRRPSAAFSRVSSAVVLLARSRRSATRSRITSSSAHLQGLVR